MVKSSVNTPSNQLVKISDKLWPIENFINTQNIDDIHENAVIKIFWDTYVEEKYIDFIIRYRTGDLEYKRGLEEESMSKEQEEIIWREIESIYWLHLTRLLKSTKEEYQEWIQDIYKQCLFYLGDFKIDPERDELIIRRINYFITDIIQQNFELTCVPVASEFMIIANFLRLRKMEEDNVMQIWADLLKNTNESLKSTVEKVEKTLWDISKK